MSFPSNSAVLPAGQVSDSANALPVEFMFSQIMAAVQKSVNLVLSCSPHKKKANDQYIAN